MKRGKIKRAIFITLLVLAVVIGLIIVFISPIAKYFIQEYDKKLIGRDIEIGWLYLNPFTGYVNLRNFKIYEPKSDSILLSAHRLSARVNLAKLFRKTYEITGIKLDEPVGYVIQNKKQLNFSDLIDRFSSKDTIEINKSKVRFNILDVKISNGKFYYTEQNIGINYFIKNVNVESKGKRWDSDSIDVKVSFLSGPTQGEFKAEGMIDLDNMRYNLGVSIKEFDLKILEQYLHDLANYGSIAAFLDADVKANGSLKNELDLDANGLITINDFHFGKTQVQDFASFKKLVLDMDQVSPRSYKYLLDSLMIDKPFFMYERYDELNNIEKMFGEQGSQIRKAEASGSTNILIEIAKYVKKIAMNFLESYYKINKVAIYHGDLQYNDFALREKFSIHASPLYLIADSIDKRYKRVGAILRSQIKPYGNLRASLHVNPNNYGTFDLRYELRQIPVSMFNPYVVSYTSFPLDRGSLDFTGYMNVIDSSINSNNHVVIVDPRVGKRLKKKDTKWLPVPFIMALTRSPGNAIDMEIPIQGRLSDPKFKLWGVVSEVLRNIFIKPPSAGYLLHAKNVEQKVEKALTLQWQMRQTDLTRKQEKFIERIVDFLKDNPEATITVSPLNYAEKEKEHLLMFEAKKIFWLRLTGKKESEFAEDDSLLVDKMSVKDSSFVRYLNQRVGDSMMYTIQEKCSYLINRNVVNARFNQLLAHRKSIFRGYFPNPSQVIFKPDQSSIPFNGFSYYSISYKGEIPEKLEKAYEELQEINEENPRVKYREKRKQRQRMIKEERTKTVQ